MRIRKEQALFLGVVLIAAWLWKSRDDTPLRTTARPDAKAFEPAPEVAVVLAAPAAHLEAPDRNVFREPTEAVPLPPTELPFPELAALAIVAPPLEPGQHAGHFTALRMPGGTAEEHPFEAVNGGHDPEDPAAPPQDPDTGSGGGTPAPGSRGLAEEELKRRFDRLWYIGSREPFYGHVIADDPLALEGRTPATFLEDVEFEFVSKNGESMGRQVVAHDKLQKIELADSLENRVARRKRALSDGIESVEDRVALLRDLLDWARDQAWVYDEAEEQAEKLIAIEPASDLGYRWLARVLRAQAAFDREEALYREPPAGFADTPFRWRLQGEFEARLGLWADAEAHLRKAVELRGGDPRNRAALARFLLERGRAGEALPHAQVAARQSGQVKEAEERMAIAELLVAVHLSLGDVSEAQAALSGMPAEGDAAQRAFLRGAVAYAAGRLAEASDHFDDAAARSTRLEPVLGRGLCAARSGAWDASKRDLERAAAEDPALRHRALAALGFLFERTGDPDRALQVLEEAARVDPSDPYTLYLLGRTLRRAGRHDAAIATLREALAVRDDFVEALAETARALLEKGLTTPEERADQLARGVRYARRVVELDPEDSGEHLHFLETYGYLLYLLGDYPRARTVLTRAAGSGSDFAEIGLAILDYRQKRGQQARTRLTSIAQDVARSPATRSTARALVERIDVHGGKEQVVDAFDRNEIGTLWEQQGKRPQLRDGALVFEGDTGPLGQESLVRKTVPGKNFLAAEVTLTVPRHVGSTDFAGLRLVRVGSSGDDFVIDLGLRRERAEIRVADGKPREGESQEPEIVERLAAELGGIDFSAPQRLRIEFEPIGEGGGRHFRARLLWNGVVVKEVERLRTVTASTGAPLAVELVTKGQPVHVRFSDFRLVRIRGE